MVDTFTTTISLTKPGHGGDVGTWDTPVNGNMDIIDSLTGVVTTIGLNNSNVVLATAQFQSALIVFNSTLTGSVTITFPTSYAKAYEIQNLCSGSSAFTITLTTTAAGGQLVGCPPGELFEVRNDGVNIKYKNFGRVGTYWDYSGSSIPAWVSLCTVDPYLYCDGTTFSSATYPALATIMGGTTLPDTRGRGRFNLNDGTGRITSSISMDGNTIFHGGGNDDFQSHSHDINDPSHFHTFTAAQTLSAGGAGSGNLLTHAVAGNTGAAFTGITVQSNGGGNSGNMPPAYIGGITLIRSA
jgi:hypothetical protein